MLDSRCRWSLGASLPNESEPRYCERERALRYAGVPDTPANAPCAMVPLKPNELRRDVDKTGPPRLASTRAAASTGVWKDDDMIDDRWAFSLKQCQNIWYSLRCTPSTPTVGAAR